MPSYSTDEIAEALRGSGGVYAVAARRLGCSRLTVMRRVKAEPELAEVYEDERGLMLDEVECVIFDAARGYKRRVPRPEQGLEYVPLKEQLAAAKYLLAKKGRDRGWGEAKPDADDAQAEA